MNTTLPMTHEVTNQATPFVDLNLYAINRPLQDALRWHHPGFDAARFQALGAEAGSAAMQAHARLANTHAPELRSHDRFGRRIDQVEFHPSYHACWAVRCATACTAAPGPRGRAAMSNARRPSCSTPRPNRRCCARCR